MIVELYVVVLVLIGFYVYKWDVLILGGIDVFIYFGLFVGVLFIMIFYDVLCVYFRIKKLDF